MAFSMLTRVPSRVLMVAAMVCGCQCLAWSQVVPAKDGSMLTPPPVSVDTYPKEVGSEVRSNYLRMGLIFRGGYIDNLYAGSADSALGETILSIRPTIAFDATSYRQQETLLYSPGFTFYRPTGALDVIDQSVLFNFRFRLSPHQSIKANENFQQGGSSFSPSSYAGGSGSSNTGVLAPFSNTLTNAANAEYSIQFSPADMLGISGSFYNLHYPDLSDVPGLYDSDEQGGAAFYSHRIAGSQYIGTTYRYSRIRSYPQDAHSEIETQTHTFYLFYTIYPKPGLSFSVSGGPQVFNSEYSLPGSTTAQTPTSTGNSWSPGATASMSWQKSHANFTARYTRSTSAGGGLLGTFDSNTASALVRWRASRDWTLGVSADYSILKSVTPLPFFSTNLGGHTIAGLATVDHPFNTHFGVLFEYDRLHQSYAGVPVLLTNPDSNRELVSVYWQLARPLGR
jgi:hypothetical protein